METNHQDPVDQTQETSGTPSNVNEETKPTDTVAYDSFKKALNEKKKFQSENESLKQKLAELSNEKLKAEGKKDELLNSYESKIKELESKLSSKDQTYAWNTLTGKIKEEALKNGCQNPDKLIKLMDDDDLKSIEIGDDFSINTDSVKKVIEKNKKENFFLFGDSSKRIADGNPTRIVKEKSDDLSKMSLEELKEKYKTMNK